MNALSKWMVREAEILDEIYYPLEEYELNSASEESQEEEIDHSDNTFERDQSEAILNNDPIVNNQGLKNKDKSSS